ncbi:MAG TPA: hypothetical protein VE956_00155 [Nodularia sp. (in: cyanobacteria)]|nr:hypothetical protein [Nodularia sp. (in: cyanobacteria)]
MKQKKKHTRHQKQLCPKCDYQLDAATGLTEEDITPREGDFSVCLNCCSVLRFGNNLQLYQSTLEEAQKFGLDKQLREGIAAIKSFRNDSKKDFN